MRESIQSCISGYLIVESYFKLIEEQKIDFSTAFNRTTNQKSIEESKIKEWTEDEYIILKHLGNGSMFKVELIYQIDTCHLFAIKKSNTLDEEVTELNKQEYDNYLTINYPLIPKFYGKQKEDNYLILQYIHGKTLDEIDHTQLTKEDKIKIIMELMLIINYLHEQKFVYIDLKPSNIIIDENKTIFLIDFDRMVKINSPNDEFENFTKSFASNFVAPEVNYGEITYKNDIYSIGKMIHYLFIENEKATFVYKKCTENDANKRPSSMYELMYNFYSFFMREIDQKIFDNIPEIQFIQGNIYYEGKYIERDINKSIHYFLLAANQADIIPPHISKVLLSFPLVVKYKKITHEAIKNEISSYKNGDRSKIIQFTSDVYQYIKINNLEDIENLNSEFKKNINNAKKLIRNMILKIPIK